MVDENISLLLGNTAERLAKALNVFEKTTADLEEDIKILRDWSKSQAHLPEVPCDEFLRNILLLNEFSIEKSKQHIDSYYSIRGLIPELFTERSFKRPNVRIASEIFSSIPFPKLTEEGYRVSINKFEHNNSDDFNVYHVVTYIENALDIRMLADVMIGDIVICDMGFLTFSHISKITPMHLKKIFGTEKVYANITKQVHFVNVSSIVETLISLVKQAVGSYVTDGIFAHSTFESLHKYVPKDVLPKEYGGVEYTIAEIKGKWQSIQEKYESRLVALETLRTDESKRPTPLKNDEFLGFYGNFKKLNVD